MCVYGGGGGGLYKSLIKSLGSGVLSGTNMIQAPMLVSIFAPLSALGA